jgi:hypothetical protein
VLVVVASLITDRSAAAEKLLANSNTASGSNSFFIMLQLTN